MWLYSEDSKLHLLHCNNTFYYWDRHGRKFYQSWFHVVLSIFLTPKQYSKNDFFTFSKTTLMTLVIYNHIFFYLKCKYLRNICKHLKIWWAKTNWQTNSFLLELKAKLNKKANMNNSVSAYWQFDWDQPIWLSDSFR